MSAVSYQEADMTFTRGDTARIDVAVLDTDGEPFNLTGCTLFLTVKTALSVADASATISKTVTTHDDAAAGESHFDIDAGQNTPAGKYVYDVQLKDSTGKIYTLFAGLWTVLGDVTLRTS